MAGSRSEGVDVLVVEDDASLRRAVVRGLEKAGWIVAAAATGGEALRVAERARPSVLVVDVLLPDAGGLGVARALRSRPALSGVPVLFVTGLSTPLVERALAPAPVLHKPFTYWQLLAAVRALAGPGLEPRLA